METKTLEELANDPVMGKAFREIADYFKAIEVKLTAERPSPDNGNDGGGGMPTDNARGRDITQDRPTPPGLSAELAALIPGSRIALIPEAGHLTNLERPAEFNQALDDFLADIAG